MKRRMSLIALLVLVPCTAFAKDPPRDPAAAQTLFYDARALMHAGKYIEACPKLEESLRLDAGIGTAFNLADCNEHIGKTASAWAGFLDVAAQSKASNQPEREKIARKRAQALEARLPRLVIDVSAAVPGLEVRRDGALVGTAAWGVAIPVDAGTHRIRASAPGREPWETSVHAASGTTAHVHVPRDLPAVAVAVAPVPVPVAPAPPGPSTPSTPSDSASTTTTSAWLEPPGFPPPVVEGGGSPQRGLGWIAVGLGVAGLGVGAGFGLTSISKRDESRNHCVVDACDAAGIGLRDDAIRDGNIATIATIVGGASLVGGIVLVLTARRDGPPREGASDVRVGLASAPGGGGLVMRGAFQ